MELPESTGGYEMRVPLSGNGVAATPTAADVELLAGTASASPLDGGVPSMDAKVVAGTRSYLGTLAKVNEMYASRRYELALIELVELERQHPEDARIQAMKGSLYLKLQKPRLAREAWQRALTLNPGDEGVAEALRELSASAQE
jgi:tetratricopeptide (TPR) repeat protein